VHGENSRKSALKQRFTSYFCVPAHVGSAELINKKTLPPSNTFATASTTPLFIPIPHAPAVKFWFSLKFVMLFLNFIGDALGGCNFALANFFFILFFYF
jgi:hypothetical protein